ncbi:alpha/beta hydrolase [Saccharopolyspora gloriosae]|uniref:alpha/beta hydrolase n=1 Tax=Saccharopolyspora gloriosae TaxID=455344 RepID=UPI001FB7C8BF|nr:alpha/beta hydrolase [Saccharopolyspora gloriosae]
MVNIGDLRRWNPNLLDDAIDDLKREQDKLVRLNDELASSGRPKEWHGKAADSATAEHGKLGERMRELVVEVSAVRSAAIPTVDEIREVQNQLTELDGLARAYNFRIGDDGKVEDLGTPPDTPADEVSTVNENRYRQIRPDLRERVERVLKRATDADTELAKVLGDADKGLMDTRGAKILADAAALGDARGLGETIEPPPPGDPAKNADWWKSLPAETKSALAAAPPAWLGNMDGIPATVRNTANVNRIDDERSTLQAEATRLQSAANKRYPGPGGDLVQGRYQRELDKVNAKLTSLDKVETVLGRGDRQLLVLDTSGERTKAAVGIGDVDTADHVSVFTPGMDSSVEGGSLGDYDRSMDMLAQDAQSQSDQYGDGGEVATVTWLGYEAPQLSETLDPSDSVASSAPAKRGAEDLADFYRGINESRTDDPNLVAMGHSYGSTTTGYALQEEGTGVDAALTLGSPGVGTPSVGEINLPEDRFYNLESGWDVVADLGHFGGDPSWKPGIDDLSTEDAVAPDGQHLKESSGHGTGGPTGYLTRGNTSQYNASVVAAGIPDRAVNSWG